MAAFWQQLATSYGHKTSVDLARRQTFNTTTTAGAKRTIDEVRNAQDDQPDLPIHRRTVSNSVQAHIQLERAEHRPPRLQPSRIISPVGNGTQADARSTAAPLAATRSTPGPSQNPLLSLRHPRYALPERMVENFEALGVRAIYPWQSSCLLGKGLLTGEQNLVYTAPTGGGKSLVADVLLLKRVIENPTKRAILVLPYVALVQEKLRWLRALADGVFKHSDEVTDGSPLPSWRRPSTTIRVSGFFGGSRSNVNFSDCDVALCTIEKANLLVNTAIEEGKHGDICMVVLDELHMINDEHRGYLMELLATKLMALETSDSKVQMVGMSATLPNPQLLAQWLKAKFYVAKYRPIPVEEHLVYENAIYPTANAKEFSRTASQLTTKDAISTPRPKPQRTIQRSTHHEMGNPLTNAVVALAVDTALAGHGALVFCSSRLGSEKTALLISDALPTDHVDQDTLDKRQDLLASLRALPGGFESSFSKTISCGVAFHHAGLTTEERDLVAEAYDKGVLKVMVATCSLAAGINLPARRVILNGARMGRDLVGPAMLRQMRGRAGRKGKDEVGETYLCCHKNDLEAVAALLEAELPPVESCLTPEKQGITRALLEIIGTRMASSKSSVDDYVRSSLLWRTMDHSQVLEMVEKAIDDLRAKQLIQGGQYDDCFEPTKVGMAVVASGLGPEDGVFVHSELRRALESFVMDGEMHIFYLFTPVQTAGLAEISWLTFRNQLEGLDDSGMRAMRLVGVDPAFVNRLVNSGGELKENTADEIRLARVYRRTYSAFQLRDLCNEMPVHEVSLKYSVHRGQVQNLSQTCHGFAAGMIKFCERMGWGMLRAVQEHMLDRLHAGAREDLLEMAQVAFVKSRMARIFWENGFKSIRALSEADPQALVPVMAQAQARKLKLQGEAATRFMAKLLSKAEVIVSSANRLWMKQQMAQWEEE
ncbi:DNA polymerase theta subunit [Cladophialophora yegresii CBS 114405]|uniref:DNA polymerase theta subunit n=1 Tax=Cladophialophora yegresii CBS 114405 TaxID=1182544 RepID=W9WHQ9_9EURO|nr:DNA polymerase theta subunit [Cladophialophora yegresii CBS 114405]EXJ64515.1 DNA polymerase theta subunit [Cladophialophora yegresii CBS 114405]